MKRTIIRIMGIGLAGITAFINRGHAGSATITVGGAYVYKSWTESWTGCVARRTEGTNSTTFASYYGNNSAWANICSGLQYVDGDEIWCEDCSVFSKCTGVSNLTSEYKGTKCAYRSEEYAVNPGYTFSRCVQGYYRTTAGMVAEIGGIKYYCSIDATGYPQSGPFEKCCTPCPVFTWSSGSGATSPNTYTPPIFELSGWTWGTPTGTGVYEITDCSAYSTNSFADTRGSYIYDGNCPYKK